MAQTKEERFWNFISNYKHQTDGDVNVFISRAASAFDISPQYENICRKQLDENFTTYRDRFMEYSRLNDAIAGAPQKSSFDVLDDGYRAFPKIAFPPEAVEKAPVVVPAVAPVIMTVPRASIKPAQFKLPKR